MNHGFRPNRIIELTSSQATPRIKADYWLQLLESHIYGDGSFTVEGMAGPYRMAIECIENGVLLDVYNDAGESRQVEIKGRTWLGRMRDWLELAERHEHSQLKTMQAAETARREFHNSCGQHLQVCMGEHHISMDENTGRDLFGIMAELTKPRITRKGWSNARNGGGPNLLKPLAKPVFPR